MTLFQKLQDFQRQAERRGDAGLMPDDAIAVARIMNIERLCNDLESRADQAGVTLKQAVEKIPWDLVGKAYPFSEPAHEVIKKLAQ